MLIKSQEKLIVPRHTEAEKNLNDDISSYTKTINDLLVKLIFKELKKFNKGLTKALINGNGILNDSKYFVEKGSQNYLMFQTVFRYFLLNSIMWLWHGNLKFCKVKAGKVLLHHTTVLIQNCIILICLNFN